MALVPFLRRFLHRVRQIRSCCNCRYSNVLQIAGCKKFGFGSRIACDCVPLRFRGQPSQFRSALTESSESETIRAVRAKRPVVFRFFTSICTAAAILSHSLFGCCNHSAAEHAHPAEATPEQGSPCRCGHASHSRPAVLQPENGPEAELPERNDCPKRNHCHDETCSFVAAALVAVPTPFQSMMLDMLPADASPTAGEAALDGIHRALEWYCAGVPLTLRAQQRLGVWQV